MEKSINIYAKGFDIKGNESPEMKCLLVTLHLNETLTEKEQCRAIEEQLKTILPQNLKRIFHPEIRRYEVEKNPEYPGEDNLSIFGGFKRRGDGSVTGAVMAAFV